MISLRIAVVVLTTLAVAQHAVNSTTPKAASEPRLPVIDYNACPFEGCTFGKWKVTKNSIVYSSWQKERTELARIKPEDQVTGITGVHITRRPDRIMVRQPIPDLGLNPGDVVLRYMNLGEGFANVWFKDAWHKAEDCTFITEKNGEGCLRDCPAVVTEVGVKEWWVKIRTTDGKTGWVLVEDNFDGMDAFA